MFVIGFMFIGFSFFDRCMQFGLLDFMIMLFVLLFMVNFSKLLKIFVCSEVDIGYRGEEKCCCFVNVFVFFCKVFFCKFFMKFCLFIGVIIVFVILFKNEVVVYDDFCKFVEFQIKLGIYGFVFVGIMGEFFIFMYEEYFDVVCVVVENMKGCVLVIVGIGFNFIKEVVEFICFFYEVGVDGMFVVVFYYNKLSQEGVFCYFVVIVEVIDKFIIIYLIFGCCGIEISVGVFECFCVKYLYVCYIKEVGGFVDCVDQIKQVLGKDIIVFSGDDSLMLFFMVVGVEGVISVVLNLLLKDIV